MKIIVSTERLFLSEITEKDAAFIYELMNDAAWIKNIGNRNIKSLQDAENYITEKFIKSYNKNGFGFYAIRLKGSKIPIGTCGLIKREGLDAMDIGYGLLPLFRGKGYAFEATKAMYKYGYEVLKEPKIIAIVNPNNKTSIALIEKLGMTFEKMIKLPKETEAIKLFSPS